MSRTKRRTYTKCNKRNKRRTVHRTNKNKKTRRMRYRGGELRITNNPDEWIRDAINWLTLVEPVKEPGYSDVPPPPPPPLYKVSALSTEADRKFKYSMFQVLGAKQVSNDDRIDIMERTNLTNVNQALLLNKLLINYPGDIATLNPLYLSPYE